MKSIRDIVLFWILVLFAACILAAELAQPGCQINPAVQQQNDAAASQFAHDIGEDPKGK